MPSEKSQAFATRLPADEAATLERAMNETDRSKSELLRRALRYYRRRNPDDIAAIGRARIVDRVKSERPRQYPRDVGVHGRDVLLEGVGGYGGRGVLTDPVQVQQL